MESNLRCLSLAVAAGSPVLLQGPVGSGKTCLVQHLAELTGRHGSPHFLKIQLGDQTDSKVCRNSLVHGTPPVALGVRVFTPGPSQVKFKISNWQLNLSSPV